MLFIYLFLAVLGLHCCMWAFSRLLIVVLLLWFVGSRARASVVVAHGLSCPVACGIFPEKGMKLVSLTLAGRSLISGPPGKSWTSVLERRKQRLGVSGSRGPAGLHVTQCVGSPVPAASFWQVGVLRWALSPLSRVSCICAQSKHSQGREAWDPGPDLPPTPCVTQDRGLTLCLSFPMSG